MISDQDAGHVHGKIPVALKPGRQSIRKQTEAKQKCFRQYRIFQMEQPQQSQRHPGNQHSDQSTDDNLQ